MGLVLALLIVLLCLILTEGVLRAASHFVDDRTSGWDSGASFRILAVGDSHTYGGAVPREKSYPRHLQRLLNKQNPGFYSVINLGLPGMSTTQVVNRLVVWLGRYEPDLLIVWCGANNFWNHSELDADDRSWWQQVDGWAHSLRVYRFVRVWFHDRQLEKSVEEFATPGEVADHEGGMTAKIRWTVEHAGGVIEEVVEEHGDAPFSLEHVGARTESDLTSMAQYAEGVGVPMILVKYPVGASPLFTAINDAIDSVAERYHIPVVNSARSISRIPREEQVWLWAAHPSGPMYEEVARDLVPIVGDITR